MARWRMSGGRGGEPSEGCRDRRRTSLSPYLPLFSLLMRLEALERDDRPATGVSESDLVTVQVGHTLQYQILKALLGQLCTLPKGLTKRAEICREPPAEAAGPRGCRPEWATRAQARAERPVRSA